MTMTSQLASPLITEEKASSTTEVPSPRKITTTTTGRKTQIVRATGVGFPVDDNFIRVTVEDGFLEEEDTVKRIKTNG